ncbi:MAG: hypothetical protein AAF458_17615 [Pseudomonadota bacterium]
MAPDSTVQSHREVLELLYPIAPTPDAPGQVAFEIAETGESVTFAELEARTNQIAQLFRASGVGRSDHIALLGRLHIRDDDGMELPVGEMGTAYFSEDHASSCHKDAERTRAAYNQLGGSTPGDIGKLDDAGFLYLLERKSFVIISGGVNVNPQDAENLLISHPAVLDAAVFDVPDEDLGEAVKGVVQLVPPEVEPIGMHRC